MPDRDDAAQKLALADILVEDILKMSDEEILAEAIEDGISAEDALARVKGRFKAAEADLSKAKLRAARAAVDEDRQNTNVVKLESKEVIERYRKAVRSGEGLTLAARNGTHMSTNDELNLIEDMIELGIDIDDGD
ncbi:hypothetical protein [Rhizobium sp. LCM 4573]|uniref:hypothetical protein n=1 Tax=Rhizobium sp. LCM 4573 TaxID=1848291 RepID=UPI0008D9BBAB|nr:hypothetical protein [Rhizobium sp. LCM 4573]OHV82596.1 hypothetical protein LCM4573_16480 [Rhizobium sp. LCM 4573]